MAWLPTISRWRAWRCCIASRASPSNTATNTAPCRKCSAAEADAVRITNFGGLMRRWAWGAELQRDDAQLVIFTTSSRTRFLHYTLERILGSKRRTPGVEMIFTKEIVCTASSPGQRLYAEADGEYIGGPPVKIEIVPEYAEPADESEGLRRTVGTCHPLPDRRMPRSCRAQSQDCAGDGHAHAGRGGARHRHPLVFQRIDGRLRASSRIYAYLPRHPRDGGSDRGWYGSVAGCS